MTFFLLLTDLRIHNMQSNKYIKMNMLKVKHIMTNFLLASIQRQKINDKCMRRDT